MRPFRIVCGQNVKEKLARRRNKAFYDQEIISPTNINFDNKSEIRFHQLEKPTNFRACQLRRPAENPNCICSNGD
jgi:hypothetical protein